MPPPEQVYGAQKKKVIMANLWNLNMVLVTVVLLLVLGGDSKSVHGENYNAAREFNNRAWTGQCENLSPQNYIEMDHVRNSVFASCLPARPSCPVLSIVCMQSSRAFLVLLLADWITGG